ncbi:uncharacterized protein AB9W97_000720 isoform 1-T1 [Spinachia spinachia]
MCAARSVSLEGFLEKRKDTMRWRWATYWFRLQNATMFFYTQRNGSASHLRGCYYIFKVQSVREVQEVNKRFVFEITMTDGRRKVLVPEVKPPTQMDERVYDVPLSTRRADEHPEPTESIYDVPRSLLRNRPDGASEEEEEQQQRDDRAYWRI